MSRLVSTVSGRSRFSLFNRLVRFRDWVADCFRSAATKRLRPALLGLESLESREVLSGFAGTVWNDVNGNGIQDGGEKVLSGVTVNLISSSTTVSSVNTNSSGQYSFSSLFPGTYYLQFVAPSGWKISTPPNGTSSPQTIIHIEDGPDITYTVNAGMFQVPLNLAPGGGGVCPPESVTSGAGAGGQTRGGYSAAGVNYATGSVAISRSDLGSDGFGTAFGQNWSWTSEAGYSDATSGSGATASSSPRLAQVNGDTSISLITNATTAHFFDLVSGVYQNRFYDTATLTHDTLNGRFVVTDGTGQVFTFYDFSGSTPTGRAGKMVSQADANGNVTEVTSWDLAGRPTEVQRVSGSGSSALTESFVYTYVSSGVNAGLLATVTQRTRVGTGSWTTARSAEYTYHDGTTSVGKAGDLRTAVVKDASGNTIDASYYRYFTTGSTSQLKYAFESDAFAKLTAALGAGIDSLTDNQVNDYASKYLEYDISGRVTTVVDAAAGCSVCSSGQGEFTYSYTTSANADGFNSWKTKTVETLPDGSTNTIYTNAYGQVMLQVFDDVATSGLWITYYQYDAAGRTILEAGPSAVSGYDEQYADLVHVVSGNAQYLRDSDGLITVYAYGSSTTATTLASGDVVGHLKQTAITHGETGTAIPQETLSYIVRTAGGEDFFFVASDTVYRNDDGTGGQTTSYSYTWQGSTAQIASVTTTLPTVTTAQNGSGVAATTTTAFDEFGRPIWQKDQAGFLAYTEYDDTTGGVVKVIQDVDTTQTGTFANLPSGWGTPTGGGLHLTTTYEVDSQGRATKTTYPNGRVDYTVYNDANHEVRTYAGWNSSTHTATGPTTVSREDRASGYTETLTMSATPALNGSNLPTGGEAISAIQSLSRSYTNDAGQVTHTDAYFNLSGLTYSTSTSLGTEGVNFYRTRYQYDANGLLNKTVSPEGTIYRTVYDGLGRVVSEWVGTDDTPTTGFWSPTNLTGTNMVPVSEYEYDDGGVGDSNLTKVTDFPGGGAAARVTQTWFDWRNRAVAVKSGVEGSESTSVNRSIEYRDYDNLNEVIKVRVYDGDGVTPTVSSGVPVAPSSSLLRDQTTYDYDELGRLFQTKQYSINQTTGAVSANSLVTLTWYDARGLMIKQSMPNGLVQKMTFDSVGRATVRYTTDGGGDSGYADADDVTGDNVLEQAETTYDKSGNVLISVTRQRFHNASGTGALGSPSSGIGARVSYTGYYYDLADRLTDAVDVGTNNGSSWTRPSTPPSSSSTALVTHYTYDAAGQLFEATDPAGHVTRTEYDPLGRTTKTIENYVDSVVSDVDDKTTSYTYNSVGMTSVVAHLAGGGVQTTQYVYGVSQSTGSTQDSNDIVGVTQWPDSSTGAASSSEQEAVMVNALGETLTSTDRNGTTHELTYDALGRVIIDKVTNFGGGVDQTIKRIETAYDIHGNVLKVTSYNATSGGTIVNEILRDYNGLGQLITEWQSHSGAVVTSTTPKVQYAYDFNASGTTNQSRLVSVTYPSGYVLTFNYSSGINNAISRLSSLSDSTGTLENYQYLGLGTVVIRSHPQPDLTQTLVGTPGDGGDQYAGLDRFGRVVDLKWEHASSAVSQYQYGYDPLGNRLSREDVVNSAFDETYEYDSFNQLTNFTRGGHTQDWDYDALGNWDSVTTDGGSPETRTHNAQNEITGIAGATAPVYDDNGNMTGDEAGRTLLYDAWNRLVEVASGDQTVRYEYDGLNRRVSRDFTQSEADPVTTEFFYSASWQVLEERTSEVIDEEPVTSVIRYVWSPVYVDAMVLRDRDVDKDGEINLGSGDERLWVVQDANFNVVALVSNTGAVVERYVYDPYGQATVLDANYSAKVNGSDYAWVYLHQGGRLDEASGLYHFRNRDYSATLGRWVSVDPIRFDAGDVNLYRFVGNNPANQNDPSGLADKDSVFPFPKERIVVQPDGTKKGEGYPFSANPKYKKRNDALGGPERYYVVVLITDHTTEIDIDGWQRDEPNAKIHQQVRNLNDAVSILKRYQDGSIGRLIISGHNNGTGCGVSVAASRWPHITEKDDQTPISYKTVTGDSAKLISKKLTSDAVVVLAACKAGADPKKMQTLADNLGHPVQASDGDCMLGYDTAGKFRQVNPTEWNRK